MHAVEPVESRLLGESVFDAAQPGTLAMAMVLIQDAIRMGQPDLALSLIDATRKRWGQDPGLCLVETMLEAKCGRLQEARRCLESAQSIEPDAVVTRVYDAMLAIESRDFAVAGQRLREVIRRCPDYPGVAGMLASVLMPGPNYRDVLSALHRMLRPRGYLEIGVETGATLGLARAERIVGIDPDLGPLRRERLATHAQLFEMKSVEFFERHRREQVLGEVPLDLAFIDGLHRFDAALRDLLALERWAHPKTVVVMHDALPIAKIYAEPERRTRFWVGDVWKAVFVLLRCRPDLSIHIVPTVPSGLVVIRWQGQDVTSSAADASKLVAQTEFPQLGEEDPVWPLEFPLVTNDADGYAKALGLR